MNTVKFLYYLKSLGGQQMALITMPMVGQTKLQGMLLMELTTTTMDKSTNPASLSPRVNHTSLSQKAR